MSGGIESNPGGYRKRRKRGKRIAEWAVAVADKVVLAQRNIGRRPRHSLRAEHPGIETQDAVVPRIRHPEVTRRIERDVGLIGRRRNRKRECSAGNPALIGPVGGESGLSQNKIGQDTTGLRKRQRKAHNAVIAAVDHIKVAGFVDRKPDGSGETGCGRVTRPRCERGDEIGLAYRDVRLSGHSQNCWHYGSRGRGYFPYRRHKEREDSSRDPEQCPGDCKTPGPPPGSD